MSHEYYNREWVECVQELQDLGGKELDLEARAKQLPRAEDDDGEEDLREKNGYPFPSVDLFCEELYNHHAELYVRYLQVFRRLERCYDQVIHPQKGETLQSTLQLVIQRMRFHKTKAVHLSKEPGVNNHPELDRVLVDLELPPSALNVPSPAFIREENASTDPFIQQENKAKQKALAEMNEVFIAMREIGELEIPPEPSLRHPNFPEPQPMTLEDAMKLFARVELWRQDKASASTSISIAFEKPRYNYGKVQQIVAARNLQKHWKGRVARKKVKEEMEEEAAFIGLVPKSEKQMTSEPLFSDVTLPSTVAPVPSETKNIMRRQKFRRERMIDYEQSKADMKQQMLTDEYEFIKEEKVAHMWEHLLWRHSKYNKWDKDLSKYSMNREEWADPPPKEPEEKDSKDAKGKGKKDDKGKKKDKKKKEKKKKKKKGKKGVDEMAVLLTRTPTYLPPKKFVETVNKEVESFEERWSEALKTEDNVAQSHDPERIRSLELEALGAKAHAEALKQVEKELGRARAAHGMADGKKKGKGGKKKGKGGKKKKKKAG